MTAHFQDLLPKVRWIWPRPTPPQIWYGKDEKANTFDVAIKRILVLGAAAGPALRFLAPWDGLSEPVGKANHKMVLRNDPGRYNYRA
jgi:hypothetical protein